MPSRRRFPRIAGFVILLQAGCLAGCMPVALLSALLGGGGGGIGGSPSAIQNSLPADTTVQKALSLDQSVKSACLDELPKLPPPPEDGCTTRQACVPGADHPLLLRMCTGKMAAAQAQAVIPLPRPRDWDWDAAP